VLKSLLVFRPLNLLIVAILQLITFYFLDYNHAPIGIEVIYLVSASVLIAAGGYLFNDYMDQAADAFNKPKKVYIQDWSNVLTWFAFALFNGLALVLSYLISTELVYIHAVIIAVLVLYSVILKRLPLVGNFVISVLAAFSVYIVYYVFGTQDRKLVVFYAAFAALLTYIREIVKDVEDLDGDAKVGYSTLPVLAGKSQSRIIVLFTGVFILVSYTNLLWQWILGQFKMPIQGVVMSYHGMCVLLPILVFLYLTYKAESKYDYSRLSQLAKYIMLTGLLSMMFY
jgi:4-hydroxybenzoate polyprenyltransferase